MSTSTSRATKSIRFEVKDADKGLVEACFATLGVKDYDGDFTLPGAFENGAEVVISAYGHKSWMGALPVGQGTIREEGDKAICSAEFFLDTECGKETFGVIKKLGAKQEWSYGFDVLEQGELTEDLRQKGVYRVLKKLKVYEVSPVLVGAGVGTQTTSVKEKLAQDAAAAAIALEARREFARFQKKRATLVSVGRQ